MSQATLKPKYKTFTYHTDVTWLDNRAGRLRSDKRPQMRVASPPEFKGEADVWTPEHLFVAAVEACTMATFLAFAHKKGIPLVAYTCTAKGVLEFDEGLYRFTQVVLRPHIVVAENTAVEQTQQVLRDAHEKCLISNSINATVAIEPNVEVSPVELELESVAGEAHDRRL